MHLPRRFRVVFGVFSSFLRLPDKLLPMSDFSSPGIPSVTLGVLVAEAARQAGPDDRPD